MEDKKISDAVELLFKGAKMLAYHCPECKMPLFRHEDKIVCPSCKKEAEIIGEGKNAVVKLKDDSKVEKIVVSECLVDKRAPKEEVIPTENIAKDRIEKNIEETIENLTKRLKGVSEESNIAAIKEIIEVIRSLLEILEKIRILKI